MREVELDAFWIDEHAVTNAGFAVFVDETGYLTEAPSASAGRSSSPACSPTTFPPPRRSRPHRGGERSSVRTGRTRRPRPAFPTRCSPDRRKEIRAIAVGFVVVGVLVLALRDLAGRYLVDELSASPTQEDAVQSTWDILTRLLADAGWAGIALGVVALVGVWLFGPSRRGTAARRALAPYLENAALTYGVAAFAFLVIFLWGPISYVQRPLVIVAFAVLAALGIEALRRKAANEVTGATPEVS